jgi:BON domain
MASRLQQNGMLPAIVLGAALLLPYLSPAQTPAPAPDGEVVITGQRQHDEAVTEQVQKVLQDDPVLYSGHISVSTHNGVVTLEGIVEDLWDYRRALLLARRVAGRGRVVNKMEFLPEDMDKD